jgi:hypothetical protein
MGDVMTKITELTVKKLRTSIEARGNPMVAHVRKFEIIKDRRIMAALARPETFCGAEVSAYDLSFHDGKKALVQKNWPICDACGAAMAQRLKGG